MGWAGKRQVLRWFLRVLRRLALVSVQYFVSCFVLTSVQTMTKEICLKLIVLICKNLELEWPLGATQGVNETKPLQQLREVYLLTSRHFLLWLSGGRSLGWTWASNQRLSRFYVQKNICKNSSFWFCCGHCFRFDVEACGAAERERNSYFYTIYIADMFSYCRTLTEVKFQMLLALIDVQHVFVCVC